MPRRSTVFNVVLLVCLLISSRVCANELESDCAPDQIVLASTRNYASAVGHVLDLDEFVGFVCEPSGTCSNQAVNLFAPHSFVETWVFVHGNQISAEMAIDRGTRVYRALRARCDRKGPIRFVIYSWPTQRETGRLADAVIKTRRTNAEAFYFGNFLSAIASKSPLNVVAYSFGARVVCGGLHLLNGGCLEGYYLPDRGTPVAPIRVTMIAAAVEDDGILAGGRFERAMCCTDKLLLLNNSRDRALRLFWVIGRSRPKALGRTGLQCSLPSCSTVQFDWESSFGHDHSIWNYFDRPTVVDRILDNFAR